jgi:hypothetical protein
MKQMKRYILAFVIGVCIGVLCVLSFHRQTIGIITLVALPDAASESGNVGGTWNVYSIKLPDCVEMLTVKHNWVKQMSGYIDRSTDFAVAITYNSTNTVYIK